MKNYEVAANDIFGDTRVVYAVADSEENAIERAKDEFYQYHETIDFWDNWIAEEEDTVAY